VGLALKKLLLGSCNPGIDPRRIFLRARGAVDDEIIDLVRGMQAELLFS
jgi:hypothetical protein